MKGLLSLITLLILLPVQAEDIDNYLEDTRDLVSAGKHKEALERYIWFHDHALEHEPSMYGVRLSFALSYWKELGEKYPPAMKAFVGTRDRKTKELISGKENYELFHDVVSLNETLGEPEKTISLFEKIEKKPDVARSYWDLAKDTVITAKRYDIVRRYIENPTDEFIRLKVRYDQGIALYDHPHAGGKQFKEYNEKNLVEKSLKLIEVAVALGHPAAALEIQTKALELVDDARLKEAITTDKTQNEEHDSKGKK